MLLNNEHRSYYINKVCRVLTAVDGLEEKALLKEVCAAATLKLETMNFTELLKTINMVFPYIHMEQMALWNRARNQLQNTNPWFSREFVEEMAGEMGIFQRTC